MTYDLMWPRNSVGELLNMFDFSPLKTELQLKADLIETETGYTWKFDVPDIEPEQIEIQYENKRLSISVKRERSETEGRYRLRERSKEQMYRSFFVPDINAETVRASIKNGVLTIMADKNPETRSKKIPIECN